MNRFAWGMIVSLVFSLFHAPIGAAEGKRTAAQKSARKKVEIAGKPAAKSAGARTAAKTKAASASTVRQAHVKKAEAGRNVRTKDAGSGRKLASHQERLVKKVVLVKGKRKVVYQKISLAKIAPPAVPRKVQTDEIDPITGLPTLHSHVAFVLDGASSEVLYEKNAAMPLPIASITKLMTGLVVIEGKQDMNEVLEVTSEDIDRTKFTGSRLPVGARLSRADMLHIALMSSENRAASALGRNYPGGLPAFVAAMNARAKSLGMSDTHYVEPTGLSSQNVASARDLAKLVAAAHKHPVLSQYSTNDRYAVDTGGHMLQYVNSNRLIGNEDWQIELQKTGYIMEAGRCLVMQVKIASRSVVMVFLNGKGAHDRFVDAGRLRRWLSQKLIANPPTAIKAVRAPG